MTGRDDARDATTEAAVDENRLIAERRAKLATLRTQGIAFPNDFRRTHLAGQLHAAHAQASAAELEQQGIAVAVAGRMMAKRVMGKASFATIADSTGRIQLFLQMAALPDDVYGAFKGWDIGDTVGAEGTLFRTRTGELSVKVTGLRLLTKFNNLLSPGINFIAPAQTTCNYLSLLFRNFASVGARNDGAGHHWLTVIAFTPPGDIQGQRYPNNIAGQSSAPANGPGRTNHLHYNPYPNTAAPGQPFECEAGNEQYRPGQVTIGNSPGTLGDHHKVDHHENDEHHQAHYKTPAHHYLTKGVDYLAGSFRTFMPIQQHHPRGRHVQRQPQQCGDQQNGRESGKIQGPQRVGADQQHHQ